MRIEVTPEDLGRAESLCRRGSDVFREHNWRNPLALAIERTLGADVYASVTLDWISVAYRNNDRMARLGVNGEVEIFLREWRRGFAQPHTFHLGLIAL